MASGSGIVNSNSVPVTDITCVSSSDCLATTGGGFADGGETYVEEGSIIQSVDGGTTWRYGDANALPLWGVSCSSPVLCVAVGGNFYNENNEVNQSSIAEVSTDGGATWVASDPPGPTGSGPDAVSCAPGGTTCVVVGDDADPGPGTLIDSFAFASTGDFSISSAESYGQTDPAIPCTSCTLKKAGLGAQASGGDPVNTANGDFSTSIPLVSIPGKGPELSVLATYDAALAQAQAGGSSVVSPLGYGWSSGPFDQLVGAGGGGTITVVQASGAEVSFAPVASTASCTTSSTEQCYAPTEGGVTATFSEYLPWSDYFFATAGSRKLSVFNSSGQLVVVQDSNGYDESFTYAVQPGSGACPSGSGYTCDVVTDASGRALVLELDSGGQLSTLVDPAGHTWRFAHDGSGNLTSITDPRGEVTSFSYDTAAATASLTHDLTQLTYPNGQSGGPDAGTHLSIAYETASGSAAPLGAVASETDPAGRTWTFAYTGDGMGPSGGSTTATGPHGQVTIDTYVNGVLVSETTGAETSSPETWTYVRDPSTLLPQTVIDPEGNATTLTYDALGDITSKTDALGNTWTYTYNSFGEELTALPPVGSPAPETVNTYDGAGNLLTTAEVPTSGSSPTLTTTVGYTSGEPGLPTSSTDPAGGVTAYSYNAYGNLVSTTSPTGATTTAAWNVDGERYCSTSPDATKAGISCPAPGASHVAGTTSSTFDADGLVTAATDPLGNTTTYAHDPNGNVTSVTDASGNVTTTAYDADNRVTSVTDGAGTPAASTTTTTYDLAPSSCTDASQVTGAVTCTQVVQGSGGPDATTDTYADAFGNVVATVDPAGRLTTTTYTADNQVATTTNGAGTQTDSYQRNGLLTQTSYSTAPAGYTQSANVSYAYYPDGARRTMTDGTGTTTTFYDPYGRVASVTNGAGAEVTYGYDANGNLICLAYPVAGVTVGCVDGTPTSGTGVVTYGYDPSNQLTSMADWLGNTFSFAYDASGNLTTTRYPSSTSTTTTASYDQASNLTSLDFVSPGLTLDPTWTSNPDNLFASADGSPYSYSSRNQVTGAPAPSSTDAFTYDTLGNVTSITPASGTPTDLTYAPGSVLCASGPEAQGSCTSPASGATTYGVNATGARCYASTASAAGATCASPPASATTLSYAYDQAGNLTCVTAANTAGATCAAPNAADTTTSTYNGDGLRMSETPAGGTTEQFVWDSVASVPRILEDGTNVYLYGPSTNPATGTAPVEVITQATSVVHYEVNAPNDGLVELTSTGAVDALQSTNAYGGQLTQFGVPVTPFGFQGGYEDPGGLISFVHRTYDPTTAQFLSVDPLVAVTGQAYAYAGDNPVNFVDPLGLWGWNPISDVTQAWNDTGGKVVHAVATHTIGLCLNLSAGAGVFGTASGCIAFVGGHFTLVGTAGGGGSSPTGSLTLGLLLSNARQPSQLRGPFAGGGGSADLGLSVGEEASAGIANCNKTIWENQVSAGLGLDLPIPFETHGGVTDTWTWSP